MAEFPALPLWTDAYMGDTMHLTLEEHGAYLKLLMIAWRSRDCSIPDDDARIARMLGVTAARWRGRLRPAIEPFWTVAEGRWTQKRLQKEREKLATFSEVQRGRARKRWDAKSLNGQGSSDAGALPAQGDAEPMPPSPSPIKKKETLAAAPSPSPAHAREETAPAGPAAAADDASRLIILKTGWEEAEAAAAWAALVRFAGGDVDLAYYGLHRALRKGRDLLAYAGKVIRAELAERQRPAPAPAPYVDVLELAKDMARRDGLYDPSPAEGLH